MFPNTASVLQKIEDLAELDDGMDEEMFNSTTSFEEQRIADNPMLHLAQAICMDNPMLAIELADYLMAIVRHTPFVNEDCEHCGMGGECYE